MLFTLPGYQFPYFVMNRCFYLITHVTLTILNGVVRCTVVVAAAAAVLVRDCEETLG
jgi:hypothetical protein